MYKRSIINQLQEWKRSPVHKPLVIRGARQVGKSTLVREFGKEFDHFIEVNLELSADANLFRATDDVEEIWRVLCLQRHVVTEPSHSTLLFIDEIQEEPRAVALLRYFYEKMPWLYIITAGSRLNSLLKSHIAFPVSRVEYLNLRPFSFEEYLNAVAGEDLSQALGRLEVPELLHDEMIAHFNRYALIGGMPEVVANYAAHGDIVRLAPIYNSLLKGYNEDVEHYAKNEEQVKVLQHLLRSVWHSAAETVTFVNFGGSSYTSTQVHEAMRCLEKAYLLSLDYPVTSTVFPAIPSLRRSPKLITVDIGLTNIMAGIQMEYLQNKELLDTWRGRAAEQIVAQELRVLLDRQYQEEQYFWIRDKKGTTAEVDFIWQQNGQMYPVEVKTGTDSHLRSLHSFVETARREVTAVRIWSGKLSVQDACTPAPNKTPYRLVNVPFYYTGQLPEILERL